MRAIFMRLKFKTWLVLIPFLLVFYIFARLHFPSGYSFHPFGHALKLRFACPVNVEVHDFIYLKENHAKETPINGLMNEQKYFKLFSMSDIQPSEINSFNKGLCVGLNSSLGVFPTFIYDPNIDIFVSKEIYVDGSWEPIEINTMVSLLTKHPDMMLLDLGCNLGVYSIQAANMGRKVIAVDANKFNLRLLSMSLRHQKKEDKVLLLWNAVSDAHKTLSLKVKTSNVGGTHVHAEKESSEGDQLMSAITLDDLISLVKGQPVLMKIDIEAMEWEAFKGGQNFFREVDVKYLLMEWMHYKENTELAMNILEFMKSFGYQPFEVSPRLSTRLDVHEYQTWPIDLVWVKQ